MPKQSREFRTSESEGHVRQYGRWCSGSYKTEGQRLPGTACDYQFINGNHSHTKGKFYSPQYPSSYPKNSRCTYRFRAKSRERIRIVFEELNFQKGDVR
ncbi:hypothetical protein GE061_013419 [Apolygus lucorum]|uniref:CUB domain-containing protein n=1 Tax=Apolygus lucorum TaxID=248454 RepID=A0A8S9XRT2_APOLU|nr:hypothetical protein GE061_013419 [Apolygus lucorum]